MSRRTLNSSSLGLLLLGLALSCGSTTRKNIGGMGAGYCESYCDRLAECDESVDTVGCRSLCEAQVPGGSANLRPEFVSVLARCLKEQSCAALSNGTAVELCAAEAEGSVVPSPAGADFCQELASTLTDCMMEGEISAADCRLGIATYGDDAITRARACLQGPCEGVVACVNGELGPLVPPRADGGGGGGSGGGSGLDCPGAAVRCLDESTAQYCAAGASETAVCATEMTTQGIVSKGCGSDARGDGCTVDAFMDPDCEAGAPVFALCEGLAEEDLVSTYVACFQNFNGASLVIPCYQDFVDAAGTTVDCTAARVSCAVP